MRESVHEWKLNVEENVKNRVYNPFTRSDAIRYDDVRQMLAKVCGDGSVLHDMASIFDLLVEQRHQDGTNSYNFTNTVESHIGEYMQQNKGLLGKDMMFTLNVVKYANDEMKKEI